MRHLRYQIDVAVHAGERRLSWQVLQSLGVTWEKAKAIPVGEQIWYLNCSNVPDELPEFIQELPQQDADLYLK